MSATRTIAWERIGAEGTAIVVSILLAFSIDAWWSDRQEREDIRDMLIATMSDLQESQELVTFRRSIAVARRSSIVELLEASLSPDQDLDQDSLDQLLGDVSWYFSDLPISTGAINSLIASGRLSTISDPALRREIADWPRIQDQILVPLRQDYDGFFDVWMPFISESGYLPQLATITTHWPGNPDVPYSGLPLEVTQKVDHSHLLTDRKFQNVLVQLWWIQVDVLDAYNIADGWLSRTIEAIQSELAR